MTVDRWLTALRSTAAGDVAWLAVLAACLALHLAALLPPFVRPDVSDVHAYAANARGWLNGTPYPGMVPDPNAPHAILVFVPFSMLQTRVAIALWMAVAYASFALTIRLIVRELRPHRSAQLWITGGALLAALPAVLDVVRNSNMLWPVGLLVSMAWVRDRHGHATSAAAILGVAATIKPLLGMFLFLYLARRLWRTAAIFLVTGAVTILVGVLITGLPAWRAWLDAIPRIFVYGVPSNASAMGVLARTWSGDFVPWLAVAAGLAILTFWYFKIHLAHVDRDWTCVVLSSVLIAPLGWRYYLCLGLGPILALLTGQALTTRTRVALGLALVSPSLGSTTWSPVLQATLGSIPFWLILAWWIRMLREPDEISYLPGAK